MSTWPNRTALLADRRIALDALRKRSLGLGRLALLWLVGTLGLVGWISFTLPLQGLGPNGDRMMLIAAPLLVPLGLGALVPAVFVMVRGVRRDREVRDLMDLWLELDRDAGLDARLRAPGFSLTWLLLSFVPCGLGLWVSFGTAAEARTIYDAVLGMGAGVVVWGTGLLGIAKAVAHRKWVLARLRRTPAAGGR
ncbi:hypothetical protein ACF08N_24030 [Streptomyces sp. NPDC015127]|uniref:hypothetical protein n=1 Tax=Streptomyces sp. NPDC015127 TaxID=3364939 RepID=UPI0036F7677F